MTVFKAKQFRAVLLPATRLLPEVRRLHHGHEQFLGPGPVHLLADNFFNLLHGHQSYG